LQLLPQARAGRRIVGDRTKAGENRGRHGQRGKSRHSMNDLHFAAQSVATAKAWATWLSVCY
jgi:hypothetical protein